MTAPRSVSVVVGATLASQALVSMATLALPAMAPKVADALRVEPSLIGYQVSVVYAAAMLSTAFGGSFVRGWGACRTTQAALLVVVAGVLAAALPSIATLVLASLLMGAGYGLTNPAAAHLLVRYAPAAGRNLIFSLKQTGVPVGGVLAALVAPALAVTAGWQFALVTVGVAGALLALALQRPRQAWDDDRTSSLDFRRAPLGGVPMIWRTPALRRLALTALCFAGVQLCVMTFTVTLLVEQAGYGLVAAGVTLSLVQAAGIAGRLGWGWLADRMRSSTRVLLLLGGVMLASCLAVTQLGANWPPAAVRVVFLLLGATAIGWNGVFLAEVARLAPPGHAGTATGGALFFTFSGVLIGPSAFATAYAVIGSYSLTFGVAAALSAMGIGFLWRARGDAA